MEEISTSFCFICLLHLANEQGLKLENSATSSSNSDGSTDTKIGNIWDLKVSVCMHVSVSGVNFLQVYRDPEAAQTV